MLFPVTLAMIIGTSYLSVGQKYAQAQELQPLPKGATNKTAILKQSILSSAKYCSAIHDTTTARVVTLMLTDIDDQEAKCFLHCMLQRYRVMDGNGVYHHNKFQMLLSYIPDSAFLTSVKGNVPSCSKERSNSPCESAYKFMRCLYEKARAQVKIEELDQPDTDELGKW